VPEQEYEDQAKSGEDPDVLLDVPVLKVEELTLELEDLRAHVSLRADLADLVSVNVGVDAYLDKVKLEIKGVEAQVLLKVRLDRVLDTFNRALETIDHNPHILGSRPEAPDGSSETPDEASQTVRRVPDGSEETVETTFNESGEIVEENTTDRPADSSIGEATDAARKRAGELGVDLSGVEGTGSGGRVLVKDVIEAAGRGR
jgi:pyruvate/2-oxoglutarate dehydrogenase complex dihydrolipoamide acyltransferase (E2) component